MDKLAVEYSGMNLGILALWLLIDPIFTAMNAPAHLMPLIRAYMAPYASGFPLSLAIMGFNGDKQKANAYLQMAAGNAPILQMQQALEEKDHQINAMQEQMNQMNQRLMEISQKSSKKAVTAE